jgi:hypothetical protein
MLMRLLRTAAAVVAAWELVGGTVAEAREIHLQTAEGFKAVLGKWRDGVVKIIEVTGKGPAGNPVKIDSHEPKVHTPNLDDSKWKVIAPETLKNPRSTGQVYFCWYGIHVTMPDSARSSLEGILAESGPRISTRPTRAIPRRALEGLDRECR